MNPNGWGYQKEINKNIFLESAGLSKVGNYSLRKENAFRINRRVIICTSDLKYYCFPQCFHTFSSFGHALKYEGFYYLLILEVVFQLFFTFFHVNMKPFSPWKKKKDWARKQEKPSNFDTLYIHETCVFSTLSYDSAYIWALKFWF